MIFIFIMGQRNLPTSTSSIDWVVTKHEKDRIVMKNAQNGRTADCYIVNLPQRFDIKS